jgi:hypothetical protein
MRGIDRGTSRPGTDDVETLEAFLSQKIETA